MMLDNMDETERLALVATLDRLAICGIGASGYDEP
jgi:hypothetical protein